MDKSVVDIQNLFSQIEQNIDDVLFQESTLGKDLWRTLLEQHPADIAMLLARLDVQHQQHLVQQLPPRFALEVFERLDHPQQAAILVTLDQEHAAHILQHMRADKITDLFADHLADDDLKKYLKLLQKKQRHRVISLLNFDRKSAGGIMNSEIFTLQDTMSVRQGIKLLQGVQPQRKQLQQRVFITNQENRLLGYINLDELVVNKPDKLLKDMLRESEVIFDANEDQEQVANQMRHYDLLIAPVVDQNDHFLGAITADEVFDILKEEATEDVYKLSGIGAGDHSYFQTSFWTLVRQRTPWLVVLLILQSVSSMIMQHYEGVLDSNIILSLFLTMLIGTGGNAGNQSGALVVRGLTTGEMGPKNAWHVLSREFLFSIVIGLILTVIGFARVFFTDGADLIKACAISASLFAIVMVSMMIGAFLPLILDRFNFDPAHSAAPFLSTLMDIIGIFIYFTISSRILG